MATKNNETNVNPWSFRSPAVAQLADDTNYVHSLNSGMIIHRVGRVNYDYISEARAFALELQHYMNSRLSPDATALVYEEVLGDHGKMHWLLHMKSPADYGRLLEMVDHDKAFQEIYQGDRLPERGGGNWERIFVQSSFKENVLVPQHGFAKVAMDEMEPGRFLPPARHQIIDQGKPLLNSATSGAVIVRTMQARYESRDLARFYLSEWQAYVNQRLPGVVTCSQFEEMWGSQDRLHLLIHLKDLSSYGLLQQLELEDEGLRSLMTKPRVSVRGEELAWGALIEAATLNDTVLLPVAPNTGR